MTIPEQNTAVRKITCETPQNLLNVLRGIYFSSDHGQPHANKWAWRGQANADWELVPAAFRPGTLLGYVTSQYVLRTSEVDLSSANRHRAEFYALYDFLHLSDKVGLRVPGDNQVFRNNEAHQKIILPTFGLPTWPPNEILEVMAIAQHHGVPTRLLDFTSNALVAAFFAASSIKKESSDTGNHMAIWGIDRDFLYSAQIQHVPTAEDIIIVTVPRAYNGNLHAQHGFFIMDRGAGLSTSVQLNKTVEEFARLAWTTNKIDPNWKPMVKVEAPVSIVPELLQLLEVENIDRAHLMPSFDGVVAELERRRTRLEQRGDLTFLD